MVLHPEVQQKAFEEIRSVCGSDRLPSYEHDRDSLPFVTATVMETFRWALVNPLGMYRCLSQTSLAAFIRHYLAAVPHRCTSDDVYNGYYIPAGATLIPNVWLVYSRSDIETAR
jgi:hypothetical protein